MGDDRHATVIDPKLTWPAVGVNQSKVCRSCCNRRPLGRVPRRSPRSHSECDRGSLRVSLNGDLDGAEPERKDGPSALPTRFALCSRRPRSRSSDQKFWLRTVSIGSRRCVARSDVVRESRIPRRSRTYRENDGSRSVSQREFAHEPAAKREHAGQRPSAEPAGDGKDNPRSYRGARGSRLCRRQFVRSVETGGAAHAWWRLRHRLRLRFAPQHPELVNDA
jgi:hypothetical protein